MGEDLERRFREEIDAGLGKRPSSDLDDVLRRGRSKRTGLVLVMIGSVLVMSGAVLAGGVWIGQSISLRSNEGQESIQPADDQTQLPEPTSTDGTKDTDESHGIELLDGQVAFRTSGRWQEHQQWRFISDSPMGPETLLGHRAGPAAALLVISDPAPLEESCPRTTSTGATAQAFVDAIRSHAGLSSAEPVNEPIAGVDALRLDLTPVEGASMRCRPGESGARSPLSIITPPSTDVGVPVITGSRETAFGPSLTYLIEEGQRMRLYLLDLPAGSAESLAIAVIAAEENFNAAVEAAQPIIDSFEFTAS